LVSHEDLLGDFGRFRALTLRRYEWFIHVTSHLNVDAVIASGLIPHSDAMAPDEVVSMLGNDARNILCLHPLGAKIHPSGMSNRPLITFAVRGEDMPRRLGLDWSYEWPMVLSRMKLYDFEALVSNVLNDFGSVVSYDTIPPSAIRVFCKKCCPSNPLTWTPLLSMKSGDVLEHD
jgi:hypothetical protein